MIDYEEFIACTVHLSRLEQEAAFQKAFETFDTDGSGCLSVEEIGEALKASSWHSLGLDLRSKFSSTEVYSHSSTEPR